MRFGPRDLARYLAQERGWPLAASLPTSPAPIGAFSAVTMSSRSDGSPPMRTGSLFVAVRTSRGDGHHYVQDAFRNGARAALVARVPDELCGAEQDAVQVLDFRPGASCVPDASSLAAGKPLLYLVSDPVAALQRVSAWWRRQFAARVIGITGSVGKTTTKELVAACLSTRYRVLRNPGSFNNELGLPFTLLELTASHERVVLEIGVSALGEMALFSSLAGPHVAVVTAVTAAHLEAFRDLETVAAEKGELVAAIPANGLAVLNGDDPRVAAMANRTRAHTLLYGRGKECQVRADRVEARGLEGISFVAHASGTTRHLKLPIAGTHFVYAALAALAVALKEGVAIDDVVAALGRAPETQRLRQIVLPCGATLLDDTYNASPAATVAALELLASLSGRRIAVLGDMFELGDFAEEGHRSVGRYAVASGIDLLIVVGELASFIGDEARQTGLPEGRIRAVRDTTSAVDAIADLSIGAGDYVLIKGSHGMHMEEIVRCLSD